MTDHEKKPLTETAVDRKLDAAVKAIQEAQAKRDAEQDAKLARKTVPQRIVDAPQQAPVAAWIVGGVLMGVGLWLVLHSPTTDKMQMAWRGGFIVAGICALPGVMPYMVNNARSLVALVKSFRNGNGVTP